MSWNFGGGRAPYTASAVSVGTAMAVAGWYGLSRLPFAFPPSRRLTSTAYALGFNNQIAIAVLLVLLGIVTVFAIRRRPAMPTASFGSTAINKIPAVAVLAMIVSYVLFTAILYRAAEGADAYHIDWESSHFIWRLKLSDLYGLAPYRDYQFEYGPLLAYAPIWTHAVLRSFGKSHEFSYYIAHCTLNIAGLLCLVYLLNRAVVSKAAKTATLCFVGLSAFLPNMGMNGVLLRYLGAFAGLLLVHRTAVSTSYLKAVRLFLATLATAALCIGLSSEIAVSVMLGLSAYVLLSRSWRTFFPIAAAMAVTVVLTYTFLPTAYFASMFNFSQGGNNLPLLPTSIHLLLYLATFLWFVPTWLAGFKARTPETAIVCALGVLSVTLMPGALGRCDPFHVLLYGLGLFVLAFVHLATISMRKFWAYAAVYSVAFLLVLPVINAWVHHVRPETFLNWMKSNPSESFDPGALNRYETLCLPFGSYGYSKPVQNWLWSQRRMAPEYYMGGMGIYTEAQMADRLKDIARFRYVLIQRSFRDLHKQAERDACDWQWEYLRKAFLYPWRFSCVEEALLPDVEIARFLDREYRVIETVEPWLVLERRR